MLIFCVSNVVLCIIIAKHLHSGVVCPLDMLHKSRGFFHMKLCNPNLSKYFSSYEISERRNIKILKTHNFALTIIKPLC